MKPFFALNSMVTISSSGFNFGAERAAEQIASLLFALFPAAYDGLLRWPFIHVVYPSFWANWNYSTPRLKRFNLNLNRHSSNQPLPLKTKRLL